MPMFIAGPGSPFPVGTNPVSNATADLNGDGHLDLLFANYISDNVSVLFGDGNGGFTAGTPVAAGNGPREIEVGDLDGDGDIDFLSTNYSGNSVTVGLNDGTGAFVTSSAAVGNRPRGLAVGDLDGDGDLDFVSDNYLDNTVSVMLNNGSGSFTGTPLSSGGTRPTATALGDFDGDGDVDIATTNNSSNIVAFLFNNGSGVFTPGASAATGAGPRGISAGDLDGDGDTDLVVANFGANTASILINDGSGIFTALPTTLPTSNNPYAVVVADLDGDGDLDFAVSNSGSSSISVFVNDGSSTFTAAPGAPFAVGVSPGGIAVGDFDEDGLLDLASSNFGSSSTTILLNQSVHAPSGTDTTVTALEDTARVLTAADFGFSDAIDGNALLAVKITTLPGAGTLTLDGVAVTAGQLIAIADINAGKLAFTGAPNGNGAAHAAFTFQVQDNGDTSNGGTNLDPSPNTITIDVTSVNDAPAGTTSTITALEDTARVLTAADFGFSDPADSDALLAVKIATLPGAGALTNNGVAVTAGQFVSLADITAGLLVFQAAPNANGAGYAAFTFQVQDDGGTSNGGTNLDPSPNTITIDVTSVNDAPAGTTSTITALEDTARVLTAADFGFSDPADSDALLAVKIATLPGAGTLTNNGVAVTAGQFVSLADITAGLLVFQAAPNANGAGYAAFTFQVQDDGGTSNGGTNLDPSPNTITIDVTSVNDAPAGTTSTITALEDTARVLTAADFGFSDPADSDALLAVKIATLPGAGTLTNNGVAVTAGQFVSLADITAGLLVFQAAPNANGAGYAAFTFQVQDDGGTSNGGTNLDPSPNTITIDVTSVNDAPAGTTSTITALEDTARVLTAADFGFSDPADSDALLAVKIATLPGAGTLTNNGVAVTAGQFVSLADITAGHLVFQAAPNANGAGYAAFTFQVQDDGGTSNGGTNLDPSPNTITIDVTSVNDAPAGTTSTITTLEDTARALTAADFGFTDTADGNSLAAVRITTLPGAGTLRNNGVAVTAGQTVSVADINAGRLVFQAALNANGAAYAQFSFQVQDNGGTLNGGVNLDQTPNTLTVNVTAVNDAPSAVVLSNVHGPFPENTSTAARIKVADIAVSDVDGGTNNLSLSGADAGLFEIIGSTLWLRAGASLDFETNPLLNVNVNVNDPSVGGPVDATRALAIAVTDVAENINITGTNSADRLIGSNNGETIIGLGGNDGIYGNAGNDRIIGGTGADFMTGGPGNDFFVFNSISDSAPGQSGLVNNGTFSPAAGHGLRDVITDFTRGQDRLDLSAIDANNQAGGNQAFSWLGQGHLANHAPGRLIYRLFDSAGTANDKTIVYGDVNGDGRADFQIELTGLKALTASDFVL